MVQIILFVSAMLLYVGVYPYSGYRQTKNMRQNAVNIEADKSGLYKQSMIISWIPALFITTIILLDGHTLSSLGLSLKLKKDTCFSKWVVIITLVSCLVYFCYLIYIIVAVKLDSQKRAKYAKEIPDELKVVLPVTQKEKKWWQAMALSAGITEELQYRGYLFFAISLLFSNCSIWIVWIISSLIFGIGHVYQGKEAIKPLLAGFYFGFVYIVAGSILPTILLHFLQDLSVTDIMGERHYN